MGQRGVPPSPVGRRQLGKSQQSVGSLDPKLCPRDWYGLFLEAKEQPVKINRIGMRVKESITIHVLLIFESPVMSRVFV
jgi:hypothetical protein